MEWQTNDYQVEILYKKADSGWFNSGKRYAHIHFYRLVLAWHTSGDGFDFHCTGCCWFSLSIGRFEISILR